MSQWNTRGFHKRGSSLSMNGVMQKYRILGKKGEGTFSEVLKCQNIKDSKLWACKKMKQHYESIDQVNNLREIQAMKRLSPHPNILELQEVVFDKKTGTLALICELMDMNIYELIRGRRNFVPEIKVKKYMYQLCKSLEHMHRNGIFHRDVKPENILIKDELLKLADFGSCRSIYSKQPYTEYISTRWYRAPECLLTDGYYGYKMDMWSVGCVFFEVMSLHPLFPGSNEVDQIAKIHDIMGTPDPSVLNKLRNKTRGMNFNFPQKKRTGIERLLQHASAECIELIYKLCEYDPDDRITARQALRHPYFKDLRDAEKRAAKMQLAKQQIPVQVEGKAPVHLTVLRQIDPNKPAVPTATNPSTEQNKTDITDNDRTVTEEDKNVVSDQKEVQKDTAVKEDIKPEELRPDTARARVFVDSVLKDSYVKKQERKKKRHKYQPTFGSSAFQTTMSFPKLNHTGPSVNASTLFPSITTSTFKPKTKPAQQTANKNMFSYYHLPSIERRGGGF